MDEDKSLVAPCESAEAWNRITQTLLKVHAAVDRASKERESESEQCFEHKVDLKETVNSAGRHCTSI